MAEARPAGGAGRRGAGHQGGQHALRHGPGRLLVAVYAVFAISASARAGYQLLTRFEQAPVAYLLSGLAAGVYLVATVALARATATSRVVATAAVGTELAGVVVVGALTAAGVLVLGDASVWSSFGAGYGYVPLVLPVVGLWWLHRTRTRRAR